MLMPDADELRLLLRVAKLFYVNELTKTAISHEIRTSTTQVARLLKKAQQLRIVEIQFSPPVLPELAEKLQKKHPCLLEARVVPASDDEKFQMTLLAKATAQYFNENVLA